jgi:enamine deaminase RidA (YjgF/YER057c/UK114 family)
MQKSFINPANIAPPVSQYTHVVRVEGRDLAWIFVSGQVPLDPQGSLVGAGDMGQQAERIFEELRIALEAAGATLHDVVKTTFYTTDMSCYDQVVAVRNRYFDAIHPPASTNVEVRRLVQEKWLLEIEATAVVAVSAKGIDTP